MKMLLYVQQKVIRGLPSVSEDAEEHSPEQAQVRLRKWSRDQAELERRPRIHVTAR
jgi:hypothetical protein